MPVPPAQLGSGSVGGNAIIRSAEEGDAARIAALYTSLCALLRLQGFYNAYGGITLPNAGSVGLHEAMGFQPVGVYRRVGYKFGAWHDVGWWSLDLQKKRALEPSSPLKPAELQSHPVYLKALRTGQSLLRI